MAQQPSRPSMPGADGGPRSAPVAVNDLPLAALLVVLAALIGLRLAWQWMASPLPDEAYYWLWGQRLDLGYFDHPPLQAWMQRLAWELGARGVFGLRLPVWVSTLVMLAALWVLLRRALPWLGPRARLAVLAGFMAMPGVFLFTTFAFPDHLMLALLALAGIAAVRVVETLDRGEAVPALPLYATGALVGLALLTKHNAALFGVGLLALSAAHAPARGLWRSPHLWGALALALAMQAPVLWWNLAHDAATLRFNLSDRLAFDLARWPDNALAFAGFSALALSPVLLPALARVVARPGGLGGAALGRTAVAILLVAAVFWLAMTALTPVLYYWIAPAWVLLGPLMVVALRSLRALVVHLALGVVVAAVFLVNSEVVPMAALVGATDEETALLYGWPRVTPAVIEARASRPGVFLAASDYRHGAILAFETGDPTVEVFSDRASQFDIWHDPKGLAGRDAVILTTRWHPMTPAISGHFASVELLETIAVVRLGREVAVYDLWLGREMRPVLP